MGSSAPLGFVISTALVMRIHSRPKKSIHNNLEYLQCFQYLEQHKDTHERLNGRGWSWGGCHLNGMAVAGAVTVVVVVVVSSRRSSSSSSSNSTSISSSNSSSSLCEPVKMHESLGISGVGYIYIYTYIYVYIYMDTSPPMSIHIYIYKYIYTWAVGGGLTSLVDCPSRTSTAKN